MVDVSIEGVDVVWAPDKRAGVKDSSFTVKAPYTIVGEVTPGTEGNYVWFQVYELKKLVAGEPVLLAGAIEEEGVLVPLRPDALVSFARLGDKGTFEQEVGVVADMSPGEYKYRIQAGPISDETPAAPTAVVPFAVTVPERPVVELIKSPKFLIPVGIVSALGIGALGMTMANKK